MQNPVEHFWQLRLQDLQTQLNSNNFQAFVVKDSAEAERLIMDKLVPESKAESASHGGSMTLMSTKVLDRLSEMDGIELTARFSPSDVVE